MRCRAKLWQSNAAIVVIPSFILRPDHSNVIEHSTEALRPQTGPAQCRRDRAQENEQITDVLMVHFDG
jgi:hypothetical protein